MDRLAADSDKMTDGLTNGSTDESDDVWTERSFPGYCLFGKFHTGILVGIFTMNEADGRTDRTDDGHIDIQTEFQVELCFCWHTDESCN